MQTNLRRGKAASRARSAALSVAIAASASIVATFSFFVPSPALAGCGGTHISGAHAASAGNGGMHTATSIAAPSGGGGGSLGCANGSSAMALRGLPTAASGRVVEGGTAGRREAHTRTAPTRTNNTTAHLHTVRPAHRG
jgi:hypothetical protein